MELSSDFEDSLRESLLDDAEQKARDEIGPKALEQGNEFLEEYGDRHDYDVRAMVQASRWRVERTAQRVKIILEWPSPALLFDRGTADHEITATNADTLSFIWERRHDPPQWVRDEYEQEGDGWRVFLPKVEVSGLPESRFIRDTVNELRRRLSE